MPVQQQQQMLPPLKQQQYGGMAGKYMEQNVVSPLQPSPSVRKPLPSATDPGTGQRIGLDHFNFLAVLGKGNFGKVMLAETKRSKRLYGIKVLKKEFILENDEVESIRSEKRVFLIANRERHPFLTNLHACFQTETRVYFVMEYISGGDLMLHIQRGQFGTKRAKFYASEVCLALKYFHENGVIYRDLKLDNILLALDGHIKIADYGLCKEDMWFGSTTSTFCGTPEFMAPEVCLKALPPFFFFFLCFPFLSFPFLFSSLVFFFFLLFSSFLLIWSSVHLNLQDGKKSDERTVDTAGQEVQPGS